VYSHKVWESCGQKRARVCTVGVFGYAEGESGRCRGRIRSRGRKEVGKAKGSDGDNKSLVIRYHS
jgi:hypothetical protein